MTKADELRESKKELESKIKELVIDFIKENGDSVVSINCEQSFFTNYGEFKCSGLEIKITLGI